MKTYSILFTLSVSLLFCHQVDCQIGKIEFPFEFFAFENFELTRKIFVDELKIVKLATAIKSTLKTKQEKIEVKSCKKFFKMVKNC
jgi:hypothetical protein